MTPFEIHNRDGDNSLLLVCEHASAYMPPHYRNLGLAPEVARRHVAWDPGALDLALFLSRELDAPLVAGTVSRLVLDCNRPPDAPDSIPEQSEIYEIPGNVGISETERLQRTRCVYDPFHDSIAELISARHPDTVVGVHSFTPVYRGVERTVEVGMLHHDHCRLADLLLDFARSQSDLDFRRNEPYGMQDGVMHTIRRHGDGNGIANVMIEVRNDLLQSTADVSAIGALLARLLSDALVESRRDGRSACL